MKFTARRFFAAWLLLILLASVPVLSVEQPPLADYPNHLARVHIWLMSGSADAVPHVEPVWTLQPNMALELVFAFLPFFIAWEGAGRAFFL